MKQLTLQELIDYLEGKDQDLLVPNGFGPGTGYRGYNDQVVFASGEDFASVCYMLDQAKVMLGRRIYSKGQGGINVNGNTLVNMGDWGKVTDDDEITKERLDKMFERAFKPDTESFMKPCTGVLVLHDMKNPATGKTFKQENSEKTHAIALDTIVKVMTYVSETHSYEERPYNLVLRVVRHGRDCDMTPLYYLSHLKTQEYLDSCKLLEDLGFKGDVFKPRLYGGLSEDCLKVMALPDEIPDYEL